MLEHALARPATPSSRSGSRRRPLLPRLAARSLLALVLTGAAALPLLPAPAASAVEPAPAGLAELNAQAARSAAELTDGTARYEQSQARLADLQVRQAQARGEGDAAAAQAAAARARLDDVVSAEYQQPRPDAATLVLGGGDLGDTVHALASLEQVRGNQQEVLAEAAGQRRSAERLTAEADHLAAAATSERDALALQVADLGRRAQEAGDQLARAAAAVAAAGQERAGAGRASRDRAPAAAPAPGVLAPGASCGGGDLSGYPNGMLPASALCPLDGTDGLVLRADAAAAFNRMAAAGGMPCAGNSYRSYAQQVSLYRVKPSLAAVPGTSNHGWGVAIDFACGADRFGTPAYRWLETHGPTYGWSHPSWAEPGGNRPEPWHWEYTG